MVLFVISIEIVNFKQILQWTQSEYFIIPESLCSIKKKKQVVKWSDTVSYIRKQSEPNFLCNRTESTQHASTRIEGTVYTPYKPHVLYVRSRGIGLIETLTSLLDYTLGPHFFTSPHFLRLRDNSSRVFTNLIFCCNSSFNNDVLSGWINFNPSYPTFWDY